MEFWEVDAKSLKVLRLRASADVQKMKARRFIRNSVVRPERQADGEESLPRLRLK